MRHPEPFHTKPPSAQKPSTKKPEPKFQPTTPWGREFLRRLDKLHKALDGKKLM